MTTNLQLRSKHLFGVVTSPGFNDFTWERLNTDDCWVPILDSIKQTVKDKIDGKLIDYVILTQQHYAAEHNEQGNVYELLFYAKLVLGLTKDGKQATIRRSLKTDAIPLSPAGLAFPISIQWQPNPYGANSNPSKAHIDRIKELGLPGSKWENFEQDQVWHLGALEYDAIDEILSCSTQDEAKDLIRNVLDNEDIPNTGIKQMKAWEKFQKQKGPKPFDPPKFCHWGEKRLDELAPHKTDVHVQADKKCVDCREYRVWEILKKWYEQIFLKQKMKGKKEQFDGTFIEKYLRKKCLIVRGDRRTGKSQFFLSCVKDKLEHICWIKHKISRENTANICEDTWLIVLDDFAWDKHDREMMKAIMAGEYTELDGKWLSKSLRAGIPCVILCNDKDKSWYKAMKKDKDFAKECIFCNLEDFFIGRDLEDNKQLEYTGPMATLDSDDEEVQGQANAYTIIMRQDGNPSHVIWDEYQTLRENYDKQAKEINELKRAFNTAQEQMKEMRRNRNQLHFFSRDDEEGIEPNVQKKVKKDSDHFEAPTGPSRMSSTSKSSHSSAQKGSSSRFGTLELE